MEEDSTIRSFLGTKAIKAFKKGFDLAPSNMDMKADYGNALAIVSSNPMEGIQTLLSIVRADSLHLRANFHLAQLSIRSGQLEKALDRYERLTRAYPNFSDAWLGLGETYYRLGNTQKAISVLENYKALVKDPVILKQVSDFISQIKQNTNPS
jgi:cytochrome c-type biogenesis protein CcmH/NrfG